MKRNVMMIICLIGMAVSMNAQSMSEKGLRCTTETAERLIYMMKAASDGVMPTEQDWENLFALDGYKTAFSKRKDAQEWHDNIKNAFLIQFDANRKAELDSIVKKGVGFDSPFSSSFVYNFHLVNDKLNELVDFMQKLDMDKIVKNADKMVRQYLPKNANLSNAKFGNIHFVLWDGEGRAWTNGIYLDLNLALVEGKEGLIRTLAHEFHHIYMSSILESMYKQDSKDHALTAIMWNQQEGTADMISKPVMPVKQMGIYDETVVKSYNDDYFSTPQVLQELDSLTCQYLAGKITKKQYRKARECAHFEGHTTGDYMVFLIRDQLGKKAAVECFGDFAQFVRLYNEAARKASTYVFSDTFVKHIESECERAKQELKPVDLDKAVYELEINYAGFPTKVDTPEKRNEYEALKTRLYKEVKKNKCKEIDAIGMLYGWFGDDHLQTGISAHRKYRKNRTENISQKEGMEEYAPTAMTSKVDDETFLIRFPSCDGDPTLEWVKESVKNYLASGCKHLIIDIRGNGGGSDMFYEPYKELLFDKEGLCVGADIRNTPDHIKFLRSTLNDIPWIKDVIERMEKSTEEFIPLVGDETIKYDSIHPQPLKAAIIIDSGVASSGEQMVLDLKVCSSRTTIYGKGNTMGCLDYSNLRQVDFESGKAVWIPMTRSRRLPNQGIDETGIAPDVRITLPLPKKLTDNVDEWVLWVANEMKK